MPNVNISNFHTYLLYQTLWLAGKLIDWLARFNLVFAQEYSNIRQDKSNNKCDLSNKEERVQNNSIVIL